MLDRNTKTIIITALRGAGVDQQKVLAAVALLEDRGSQKFERSPALVSQAEAARLTSVSRFTIRKLVQAGKLNAVEVLPGLIRYRVEDLLKL